MGLFCTTSSLQTKMIGTTFDTATTALAVSCVTDAENELKKHLCKRYDFSASPFLTTTSIPPMLTTLAETLALGYMYENMARGGDESYKRADRYIDRVMENVKALLDGEAQLVDSAGDTITEIEGDWAVRVTTAYPQTFNEDDPHSWKVSSEKLTDIADDRDE